MLMIKTTKVYDQWGWLVRMSGHGVGPKHAAGPDGKIRRDTAKRRTGIVRPLALIALLSSVFLFLVDSNSRLLADYADGARTESMRTLQDAERVWRRAAWQQDDFLSQVRLGDLYSQNQSIPIGETPSSKSFDDPVEAYVWYFLALRPGHSYPGMNGDGGAMLSTVRNNALTNIQRLYAGLSFDQRLDARGRLIYILASRGADGFMALGRLHRTTHGDEGTGGLSCTGPSCTVCMCRESRYAHAPDSWFARIFWYIGWGFDSLFDKNPRDPVCKWKAQSTLDPASTDFDRRYGSAPDTMCPIDTSSSYSNYGSSYGSGSGYNAPGYNNTAPSLSHPVGSVSVSGDNGGTAGSSSSSVSMAPSDNGVGSGSGGYGGSYGGGSSGGDADSSDDGSDGSYASSSSAGYGSSGSSYYGSGYGSGYGGGYGGYGYPRAPSVFSRSNPEALVYFKIAERLRHPLAGLYVASVTQAIKDRYPDAQRILQDADDRARNWAPPFEYYPGSIAGGSIHSDESPVQIEQLAALERVHEIPYPLIQKILASRLFVPRPPCVSRPGCPDPAVAKFQHALGDPETGFLTPQEIVRLIQMSAVDGRSEAQNTLGIMYVKGIGVPRNYQRAEQWFIKAARQQNVEAYCNLTVLYQRSPQGIEVDDNKVARFQVEKQRILQFRGQWGVLRDDDIAAVPPTDLPKPPVAGQPDGAKR